LEIKNAAAGITRYCRKTPIKIIVGFLNTLTKSATVRVSPIENIIIIKRGIIRDRKFKNNSGNISAIMENRIAQNGKNLVITLFKKAPFTVL